MIFVFFSTFYTFSSFTRISSFSFLLQIDYLQLPSFSHPFLPLPHLPYHSIQFLFASIFFFRFLKILSSPKDRNHVASCLQHPNDACNTYCFLSMESTLLLYKNFKLSIISHHSTCGLPSSVS